MYAKYNAEQAYTREDLKNYIQQDPTLQETIVKKVLKAFVEEFQNNKNLLKEDFDVRVWSDKFILLNYDLDLSSPKLSSNVRKIKI